MLILVALALGRGVTMTSVKVRYVVTNVWQESIASIFLVSFLGVGSYVETLATTCDI